MSSVLEETPKVSVLMCVYNGERYLNKAIESILTQSFNGFEFVIINDGSTDSSAKIIKSYSDLRIRYVEQANSGLSISLIKGIDLCCGKYIARMDADDIALPERLERQYDFLEKNQTCALLGTACYVIKEDESTWFTMQHPSSNFEIRWMLLFNSPFVHSTVMIRKAALLKAGSYSHDEKFSCVEDYELWSRLTLFYEGANLPEPLLKYRSNPLGISYSKRDIQEQQSILVSAQNISRLIEKPVNYEDAEKIRYLHTGNATLWRFGGEAIIESLDLFQEIYSRFKKDNRDEFKRNSTARRRLLAEMIQTHFDAVKLYYFNHQYFPALRAMLDTIHRYPQCILTPHFWITLLLPLNNLKGILRRITKHF